MDCCPGVMRLPLKWSVLTPANLFNTFLCKKVDLLDSLVKSTHAFDYAVERQKRERGPGRLSGTSLPRIFFFQRVKLEDLQLLLAGNRLFFLIFPFYFTDLQLLE